MWGAEFAFHISWNSPQKSRAKLKTAECAAKHRRRPVILLFFRIVELYNAGIHDGHTSFLSNARCPMRANGFAGLGSLLKKGTGSERSFDFVVNFGLLRGACPLFQHPARTWFAIGQEAAAINAGHTLFAATGCANCHVEKLGPVRGIYSDLLLHDMGEQLGDTGNYGVFTPNAPEEEQPELPSQQANADGPNGGSESGELTPAQLAKVIGALRQEWRTPPLWGVRDSGPYLHDGRADTLEQAIAFHGGQATPAVVKFFQLKPAERQQLITFLKSLTAPDQAALQRSETVDSMIPQPRSTDVRRSLSIARTTTH
jgi:hypothetical protein